MKKHAIYILKFKKIKCYPNAADCMLVGVSGWHRLLGSLNKAIIARVTMSCTDNKQLSINWQMRSLMSYNFEPDTRTINFSTELLYPDTAFGGFGKDGIIYQKLDFETILLHVYDGGKEEVAEFQKYVSDGGEIYAHLEMPDEWEEVDNVYDAYVDPIR